jgi:AAA family ATPase
MKKLEIQPIGYPLRSKEETTPFLSTDDPTLFQHYARSQWIGLIVEQGSFLFDSLLFPDYAFRATTVDPDKSQITKDTLISLQSTVQNEPVQIIQNEPVNFDDVVGQKRAKEKCQIIGKFIKRKDLMKSPWTPKNILFWGPPGNGKTMMAKALSQELNVSMFLIKASDLLGVYVGDGARKIKLLYSEARNNDPAIIFIDEIDSIALKRNYQSIRGDVVELVSSLLGEMDGVSLNQGIITIGSTNQPKLLDSAILNRFEELIEFKIPSPSERLAILEKYANTSPIPFHNVKWESIVKKTENWSCRDLKERIIKGAIHHAILNDLTEISMKEVAYIVQANNPLHDDLSYFS